MNRLIGLFLLLTGTSWATATPYSLVRTNSGTGACNPSCTITIPAQTSGDLVVVAIEAFSSTVTAVSSSSDGSLTQAITGNDTNVNYRMYLFYKANVSAQASTVTFTISATSSNLRRGVAEYSGVIATSPLDGAGVCAVNQTGTSLASGNYTVTVNDLLIGWGFSNPGMTNNNLAVSAWLPRSGVEVDSNVQFQDSLAATTTANATASAGSGDWSMCGIAFKTTALTTTPTISAWNGSTIGQATGSLGKINGVAVNAPAGGYGWNGLIGSTAATTTSQLYNFNALTSGSAPTATMLANSGVGAYPTVPGNWTFPNGSTNITGDNTAPACTFATAPIIFGSVYSGSAGMGYKFATGTGGTYAELNMPAAASDLYVTYCYQSNIPQNDTSGHWYDLIGLKSTDGTDSAGINLIANGTALYVQQECVSTSGGTSYSSGSAGGSPVSLPHTGAVGVSTSTNYMFALHKVTGNPTGTVNTQNAGTGGCSSNCVTWVSGPTFPADLGQIKIASTVRTVTSVVSSTLLQLGSAPGTQTGATDSFVGTCASGTGCSTFAVYDTNGNSIGSGGCYAGTGTHNGQLVDIGVSGAQAEASAKSIWWRNLQVSQSAQPLP